MRVGFVTEATKFPRPSASSSLHSVTHPGFRPFPVGPVDCFGFSKILKILEKKSLKQDFFPVPGATVTGVTIVRFITQALVSLHM